MSHQLGELQPLRLHIASARNGLSRRPDTGDRGFLIAGLAAVGTGTLDLTRARAIALSHGEENLYRLAAGDLLVTRVNGSRSQVGRVLLVPAGVSDLVFNDHLIRIRLLPTLDARYAVLALSSPDARRQLEGFAGTSAGQLTISQDQLGEVRIRVPALARQRRIAETLSEQLLTSKALLAVVRAHVVAPDQLRARLLLDLVREANTWAAKGLGDVVRMIPSSSTTSDGEVIVMTVTTGCLTIGGFDPNGVRPNRMSSRAASEGIIEPGEILVGRSNTEMLVGRAALFSGEATGFVASDLIFRLQVEERGVDPYFLASYLQGLQLSGYWRDRSSGASSTMKKIRRSQLLDLAVPIPPLEEQRRIVAELRERLDAIDRMTQAINTQLEAVEALPAALLRRAFAEIEAA